MLRTYTDENGKLIEKDSQDFFTGFEVEKTNNHLVFTLFVVGSYSAPVILEKVKEVDADHVYLGANKYFKHNDVDETQDKHTIVTLLDKKIKVTLDYPVYKHEQVYETLGAEVFDSKYFTAMISVEIPHIRYLNKNAIVKIDDVDFEYSNDGVWTHKIKNLQTKETFTSWKEYGDDQPL